MLIENYVGEIMVNRIINEKNTLNVVEYKERNFIKVQEINPNLSK